LYFVTFDFNSLNFFDLPTIHTVVRNLISNAIKFTPQNGLIEIYTKEEGNILSLTVKDSGVGISQEVIDKIFNKNEHFSSKGTNDESGTGLGLYMVKDFVTKNKGEIRVNSTLGKGTDISILLPLNEN